MKNRNYLLLIIVMVFLAVAVRMVSYDETVTIEQGVERVKQIPLHIGDWQGQDHKLDPIIFDILETKAILHRSYRNMGHKVFLSLVYYEETKVDFHAPEGCLGGQGIKTEKSPATINITTDSGDTIHLNVNQLIQKQKDNNTLVYYFYKSGSFVGRNYLKLRLNLVLNKFKDAEKSGSLIRVSTPLSVADNGEMSRNELKSFLSSLLPYLKKYL